MAGTAKGLDTGAAPVVAVVMGVLTAAAGGIIRDILGQEPSIILRREVYVTASVMGAIAYVILFIPVVVLGRFLETRFAWRRA